MQMTQEQLDKMMLGCGYKIVHRTYPYRKYQYSRYWKRCDDGILVTVFGWNGDIYPSLEMVKDRIDRLIDAGNYENRLDEELYRMEMDGQYL